jgi:hypothetical protein
MRFMATNYLSIKKSETSQKVFEGQDRWISKPSERGDLIQRGNFPSLKKLNILKASNKVKRAIQSYPL